MKNRAQSTGKEFLGEGWAFPPGLDAELGRIAHVREEEDIEQSIYIILSTSRGERVMRPDFGCGIHDLVFEVINTSLIEQLQQNVMDSLTTYEARIDVERVDVDASKSHRGQLKIEVHYTNRDTNKSGNYVYPFYFKEVS
jgi:phage baseplate assembly protein W